MLGLTSFDAAATQCRYYFHRTTFASAFWPSSSIGPQFGKNGHEDESRSHLDMINALGLFSWTSGAGRLCKGPCVCVCVGACHGMLEVDGWTGQFHEHLYSPALSLVVNFACIERDPAVSLCFC